VFRSINVASLQARPLIKLGWVCKRPGCCSPQALPAGTAGEYTLDLADEPLRDASGKPLSQAARRRKVLPHTLPLLHDTARQRRCWPGGGVRCIKVHVRLLINSH